MPRRLQFFLNFLRPNFPYASPALYRKSGGDPVGFADGKADRHGAEIRVRHMRTAYVSSREQKPVEALREHASVGNGISFILSEFMLTAGLIQSRARKVVHVEIEMRPFYDPIVENAGGENILLGERLSPMKCRVSRIPMSDAADRI